MYYSPTSCLVLFFLFSLIHPLTCASSQQELGLCDTLFQCGEITANFPFWEGNSQKNCNHPLMELHCNKNITSLSISNQNFNVLHINQTSNTLTLARTDHLDSFCTSTFTNTTLPTEIFELSPTYKSLTVFYLCVSPDPYNPSITCPRLGLYSVSQIPRYHETCHANFTINVPTSFLPREGELNLTSLESVLRKGFEVKVKIDEKEGQDCSSSHKLCDSNKTFPVGAKCSPFHQRTALVTGSALVVVILIVTGLFCCRRKTSNHLRQQKLKALIPLKHYSYAQVERITKSFAEVVGKGGFGTVYRGTLSDGRSVAVKILKDSKGNGEDFINEVASMSKTSHVNIVSLLGFCSEGSKRAILYEFVENGSLDRFISRNTSMNMDWMALYSIALGIARGLEYLHHGCKTRIVHFDIKPQNVLLDDNLCPKVSDFGLAKLCEKKESTLSLLHTRGTIGYIAPEVFSRMFGRVSHKSDVYSYGMLVLEMIGARDKERADQNSASNTSSMYFPEWIYKDLETGVGERIIENGISIEEEEVAKKMTLVGLWCIQPSPPDRPAMNRVVEMMEGNLDALEVPPRPVLQIPAATLQESSTVSEDISVYTVV